MQNNFRGKKNFDMQFYGIYDSTPSELFLTKIYMIHKHKHKDRRNIKAGKPRPLDYPVS